jgi:hypothetical protein
MISIDICTSQRLYVTTKDALEQKVVLPAQTNKLADNELDYHKPLIEH